MKRPSKKLIPRNKTWDISAVSEIESEIITENLESIVGRLNLDKANRQTIKKEADKFNDNIKTIFSTSISNEGLGTDYIITANKGIFKKNAGSLATLYIIGALLIILCFIEFGFLFGHIISYGGDILIPAILSTFFVALTLLTGHTLKNSFISEGTNREKQFHPDYFTGFILSIISSITLIVWRAMISGEGAHNVIILLTITYFSIVTTEVILQRKLESYTKNIDLQFQAQRLVSSITIRERNWRVIFLKEFDFHKKQTEEVVINETSYTHYSTTIYFQH